VSRRWTDGRITYAVDLELKARMGIFAYWWQGAMEVLHINSRCSGGYKRADHRRLARHRRRTKNYGGPFKITTEADLYEDQFELAVLTTQSGLRYLSYLPTLWFGDLRKAEGVHFMKRTP